MSQGGRAEEMAHLRRAIAQIEAQRPRQAHAPILLPLTRALDRALGGGLAGDALHEIAPASPGDGAAAMGFALALAARFMAASNGAGLVIAEDFAAFETGAPYGPGLVAHGLALNRLVFVRTPDAPALLWAMEEALKSGALNVVVGEIWNSKPYSLAASRRLLLAARAGRAPALLVHGRAFGRANDLASAAETRFEIAGAPSVPVAAAGGRLGLPGPPVFAARLVKARLRANAQGPPGQALDDGKIMRLEWRCEERRLRDPAVSLCVADAAGERPRAQATR